MENICLIKIRKLSARRSPPKIKFSGDRGTKILTNTIKNWREKNLMVE
jgi:hypothetical protein